MTMEQDLNLIPGESYTVLTSSEKLFGCVYEGLVHGSWDAPFALRFTRVHGTTVIPWVSISAYWQA